MYYISTDGSHVIEAVHINADTNLALCQYIWSEYGDFCVGDAFVLSGDFPGYVPIKLMAVSSNAELTKELY